MAGDAVSLADLTAAALDRHWAVNTRATLLLTQAFAAQHDGRPGGRVIWMTSGQALGPMSDNVAYVASKAALAGATWVSVTVVSPNSDLELLPPRRTSVVVSGAVTEMIEHQRTRPDGANRVGDALAGDIGR